MIDLRERLHELADAAARDGVTPGPAHAIRRGRRRRRRITAATVSLVVVLALGVAGVAGQFNDRTPTRPLAPTVTSPPRGTLPLPLPEGVQTDQPSRGRPEARAFATLANELRRCPEGPSVPVDLIGYLWSREHRRFWMVAAKRPPSPQGRFCWTAGLFNDSGQGGYWGARRIRSPGTPLTALGGIYSGFAQIEGRVTRRAARVRLRFRDGRPSMDLTIVRTGRRYPANFYVGFFPQGPTSPQKGGWAAATVTALDDAGRTLATCRVGPPGDGRPKCPGN